MKIFVLAIGLICIILAILFIGYGIKGGLIEKKMTINHYNTIVTGKKAIQTGIFYIIIGVAFLVGAILTLVSLYLKVGQGNI
jgi:uncharacterized membrane protein